MGMNFVGLWLMLTISFCLLQSSSLADGDDIDQTHNTFVGRTNNVSSLITEVEFKLFKSYCSSMYGAELWALNSAYIENFVGMKESRNGKVELCVAWRKALRRILQLPHNSHSYFLPILRDT